MKLIIAVINKYMYYTILLIYVHKLTAQSGKASTMKGQILENLVVSTDLATNRLMIYGLSCWLNQAAQHLVTLHLDFSVPQQRLCSKEKPHTHMHSVRMFVLASVHVNANNKRRFTVKLCRDRSIVSCGFISVWVLASLNALGGQDVRFLLSLFCTHNHHG